MEKEQEQGTAKEACDAAPCAECFCGPGRGQARAVFLACGVPRTHRHGTRGFLNPMEKAQAPGGSIKVYDTWAKRRETEKDFSEWTSKGSIMDSGWRSQKVEWKPRTATHHGVDPTPASEGTGMVSWCMPRSGIRTCHH